MQKWQHGVRLALHESLYVRHAASVLDVGWRFLAVQVVDGGDPVRNLLRLQKIGKTRPSVQTDIAHLLAGILDAADSNRLHVAVEQVRRMGKEAATQTAALTSALEQCAAADQELQKCVRHAGLSGRGGSSTSGVGLVGGGLVKHGEADNV